MKTNGTTKAPPTLSEDVLRFRRLINSQPQVECPFLGFRDDPDTRMRFASEDNYCHCQKRPQPVALDHQQMYCLFEYVRCETFLERMAGEVREHPSVNGRSLRLIRVFNNLFGLK